MRKDRLTRGAWIEAALDVISRDGVDAVAVEPLARALGATKGSFYWHFADRAELVAAALAHWEGLATDETIAELDAIADPRVRLEALMHVAFGDERMALDAALASSGDHPVVGPVVARVTVRRIGFLARAYAQCGLAAPAARRRAHVAYATYLGLAQLARVADDVRVPLPRRGAMMRDVTALLVPPR